MCFAGTNVVIKVERPWCVLVATELMHSVQHLATAHELIFIDSSCSCDATQTTVTTVLAASQAGALPLAILLHEGKSAKFYTAAFCLPRQQLPGCLNGREVIALHLIRSTCKLILKYLFHIVFIKGFTKIARYNNLNWVTKFKKNIVYVFCCNWDCETVITIAVR